MANILSKLFGGRLGRRSARTIPDPVLGPLHFHENWWEATVTMAGQEIGIRIAGNQAPDAALLQHAHDIVGKFAEFDRMVKDFLAGEAAAQTPQVMREINELALEEVVLFAPKRPDDGALYFRGSNKLGRWRCEYLERKPYKLHFES